MLPLLPPEQLLILLDLNSDAILLLDARDPSAFSESTLRGACNLGIPSLIVNRFRKAKAAGTDFALDKIITSDSHRSQWKDGAFKYVVIFTETQDIDETSQTCMDVLEYQKLAPHQERYQLEGGLQAFSMLNRASIYFTGVSAVSSGVSSPRHTSGGRLSLALAPKDFSLQVASHLDPPVERSPTEISQAYSNITPNILLGADLTKFDLKTMMQETGVTHVLNMAREVDPENGVMTGITYLKLGLSDDPDASIEGQLDEGVKFMIDATRSGGKVLVHCLAGKSRSATIVIAYLMVVNNWTCDMAYKFLVAKRPVISPNLGFMGALKALENRMTKGPQSALLASLRNI